MRYKPSRISNRRRARDVETRKRRLGDGGVGTNLTKKKLEVVDSNRKCRYKIAGGYVTVEYILYHDCIDSALCLQASQYGQGIVCLDLTTDSNGCLAANNCWTSGNDLDFVST